VTNDPLLNRYVGSAIVAYHLSDRFGVEAWLGDSPWLGEGDVKPLTEALTGVAPGQDYWPDPRLGPRGDVSLAFTPVTGRVASRVARRRVKDFDLAISAGLGLGGTVGGYSEDGGESTHAPVPTTTIGVTTRLLLSPHAPRDVIVALRLDARMLLYVLPRYETDLDLKSDIVLQGGVSVLLPQAR
jgi:hypothetical protein